MRSGAWSTSAYDVVRKEVLVEEQYNGTCVKGNPSTESEARL